LLIIGASLLSHFEHKRNLYTPYIYIYIYIYGRERERERERQRERLASYIEEEVAS
jgi:hypothetical protein